MQISPSFAGSQKHSYPSSAAIHTPKFGQLSAQSLPELGLIPKVALPVSIVYLIYKQNSRMSAAIAETISLVREGKELDSKGRTKQMMWNAVNSTVGGAGLIGTIWSAFKHRAANTILKTTKETADKGLEIGNDALKVGNNAAALSENALALGHEVYDLANWSANKASAGWGGFKVTRPQPSKGVQSILNILNKQRALQASQ